MQKTHRFAALDLLRGIAAFAVMIFHAQSSSQRQLFNHGYLAVDLFFILSGFVVSAAYEDRLNATMSFGRFMVSVRLLRLYPLFFLSTLVSVVALYISGRVGLVHPSFVVRELLLVPSTAQFLGLYPLNLAQWSIFFELLANAAHAALLRRMKVSGLAIVMAVSAAALVLCQHHYHSMDMGPGVETFAGGLARVFFSYTVGIIMWRLYRTNSLPQVNGGWMFAPLLLLGCLCITASKASIMGQVLDLIAVAFVFPTIVMISLGSIGSLRINEICATAGNLSYPVYLLQLPVFWVCRKAFHAQGVDAVTVISSISTLAFSVVAFYLYDKPVRSWIGSWLRVRSQSLAASAP